MGKKVCVHEPLQIMPTEKFGYEQKCSLNAHDVTIKEQLATPLFPNLGVLCSLIRIHELFVQAQEVEVVIFTWQLETIAISIQDQST